MEAARTPAAPAPSRLSSGHNVVAALLAPDVETLLSALRRLPPEVQVAEVRLDGLWPKPPEPESAADQLLRITSSTDRTLLATLRPRREGGRFEGPEEVRLGLLASAARAGFHLLDLENDNADMARLLGRLSPEGAETILSRHLMARPPTRDEGLRQLQAMQDLRGALHKLVFVSGSFADSLRALELTHLHAERNGRPALSTLGHGGAMLRALLPLVGNQATYGAAPGLGPAAPGQPTLEEILGFWRHWGLSVDELSTLPPGARPWFAVLGSPVEKSLSPRMHNAAFRAAGRTERYGALDVPASPGALRLLFTVAPRIGLRGASVTFPHKTDAARMASCDEMARSVGAANQVRFMPAGPQATNTDATALARLLRPHAGAGTRAVVLGAGGAARAAAWALKSLGAEVTCTSRDPERAKALAPLGATWVPWDRRGGLRGDVWVQATTVGLAPGEPCPATPRGARVAVELNYKGGATAFQKEATAAGAAVVDGRTVVLEQAVDAFRFWAGEAPDRAVMERAILAG